MGRIAAAASAIWLLTAGALAAQNSVVSSAQPQQQRIQPGQTLTTGQKYRIHLLRSIDLPDLAGVAFGTGIDQALMVPYSWGGGASGLARRFASNFAENAVQQQLEFAVEAMDGEDPRVPVVHSRGVWHRAVSAALTTFYRHNDKGGNSIAWSEFVGAYGAAFISHQWWPRPFNDFHNGLVAGTDSVGMDVGMNVMREFMPDIRRGLHLGGSDSTGTQLQR